MGIQELLAYGASALIPLCALSYRTYQYRSKRLEQEANAIVKDRYKRGGV